MRFTFKALTVCLLAFSIQAFAAGSATVSKATRQLENGKKVRVVSIAWTGDAADGTVPATDLTNLHGFLVKVLTNPGATAPTANYDIAINDPDDSSIDAAKSLLLNRHTTSSEMVLPVTAAGEGPLFFQPGTYSLAITNNSVNSATGVIKLYFVDSL